MAKQEPAPVLYPCMIQKPDIRRVHEPSDERIVVGRSRTRRAFARLAAARR